MITLDSIRNPIEEELKSFDDFVESHITAEGELLGEMLKYALSSRGKGIRPMLVLLSAAMNATYEGAAASRRTALAATLVEMFHVASLIHDDVIDESDMRRGKPSVNARWQSQKAVVLGDYILAKALKLGLESAQYDLITHICGAMVALCEGEMLQADSADKHTMSRERYVDIIYKKTANLLGISASSGALSVGAPREKVAVMRRFGDAVGMAFQIQDDLLDYTSDKTGKPALNDLREGKITLPLLCVMERMEEDRRKDIAARLERCHEDEREVEYLREVVFNEGGIEAAREVMHAYLQRAASLLADYPESPYRKALVDLCAYIAERDR